MNKKLIYKIPITIISQAESKLDEINGSLEPFFISLTPPERQILAKSGSESVAFLEMSQRFALEYPDLFPDFINESTFRTICFISRELREFSGKIDELRDLIHDTEMLASDAALDYALDYYRTVKMAALRDLPGARCIYDELKLRFPPRKQRKRKVS